MATFVPRSEIDKDDEAIHERIEGVERRLGTIDKRVWGAPASAFGTVVLTKVGLMH
ncbi:MULTISPECIES: hypothetical protein [unclassified Methylobacterium]|uniref:hypothetical protein n=1 Tax=unclassified Methylobacterium TaxID=2615210 RepID=UPI00137028B1|nr:hypothetical protein [Methylobacterium sp. 2A]